MIETSENQSINQTIQSRKGNVHSVNPRDVEQWAAYCLAYRVDTTAKMWAEQQRCLTKVPIAG